MKYYQLTCLITPDFSETEIKDFQNKISSLIQKEGGRIEKSGSPDKKKLEYPIKEKRRAYLTTFNFYFGAQKLNQLKEKLDKEPSILRHLISTKEKPKKIKVPKITPKVREKKGKKKKKVKLGEIEEKLDEILEEL